MVSGLISCQTGSQFSVPTSQASVDGGRGVADIDHGDNPFDFVVAGSVQEVGDAATSCCFSSLSLQHLCTLSPDFGAVGA